ncbi:tyrosine protein phosphatase YVH1 [Sugiyamaella lignohabitans]|uniref:protein-tyrosine-phosphatase n=1 Tax=Sugiyamaella lignohabitans TaxID=796027 RepID=A0A167DYS3_9ASCO|nr:tyrosine protein phosphatase YVH1 [Sugiyamaella lignohabitans]ANB13451.1 tyrosine protein phosphatase YVH1 [Sugiyamaella lignohabitans]
MNKITDNIYLGSFYALSATKTLRQNNVTHILSLVETDIKSEFLEGFKHMRVQIDDIEDENIIQYFPRIIAFMDDAINAGNSILVHCMAGVSRSATAVCAYLMRTHVWTSEQALTFVKSKRSVANPNTSFLDQLKIFYLCGYEVSESKAPYRQWLLKQKATDIAMAGSIRPSDIVYTSPDSGGITKASDKSPEEESLINGIAALSTTTSVDPISLPPSPDTVASNSSTTTTSSTASSVASSTTTTSSEVLTSANKGRNVSSKRSTWRNTLPALLYVLGHRHGTPTARPQELLLVSDDHPDGVQLDLGGNPQEDLKGVTNPTLKLTGFWSCEIVIPGDQLIPGLAATTRRSTQLRCKKCAMPLALSTAFILHTPAGSSLGKGAKDSKDSKENGSSSFYKQGASQSTSHLSSFFRSSTSNGSASVNGSASERSSRFHLPHQLTRSLSQRGDRETRSANSSATSLVDNKGINFAPRNGMAINSTLPPSCMSYFIEPVVWMRPELEKGELEGKLNCPGCEAKLGSYRWQGSKCSCGVWITPAIQLQRSRVDEVQFTRNTAAL